MVRVGRVFLQVVGRDFFHTRFSKLKNYSKLMINYSLSDQFF